MPPVCKGYSRLLCRKRPRQQKRYTLLPMQASLDFSTAIRIGHQTGNTPHNNLVSFLERHRTLIPDHPALRWVAAADLAAWTGDPTHRLPHRQMSYAQLCDGIERVAAALHNLGLRHGDRVIIFLPMGPMMYTAMFAVQRLGAIAVFLDSWARRHQLGASAACVQPKAMISHHTAFEMSADMPEFAGLSLRIVAGSDAAPGYTARLEDLLSHAGGAPVEAMEAEETALVTFTTGSSGVPKGANRTHRFLCAQHETLVNLLPYGPRDTDLPAFPIFSLNNLACGITTIVPALDLAQPSEHDAALLVTQLQQEQISCATLSPSMLTGVTGFCAANGIELTHLRRLATGGAPVSRDDVGNFLQIAPRTECQVLYGSTEVEPIAHIEARDMLSLPEPNDRESIEEGVNVGHICPELDYKFIRIRQHAIELDTEGWAPLEVSHGEVGELIVSGKHVCRDYYNNPDAFRQTKIVDEQGNVWHRTGDLAQIDTQDRLWIVGRVHNVIERNGRLLFPVRAEILLKRFPFVKQAAFLGLPNTAMGQKTAGIVVHDPTICDETEARSEIQRVFAKNEIPLDSIFFVDNIPMDPRHHSKVEYEPLRARLQQVHES